MTNFRKAASKKYPKQVMNQFFDRSSYDIIYFVDYGNHQFYRITGI
jgi:hypothetical protein